MTEKQFDKCLDTLRVDPLRRFDMRLINDFLDFAGPDKCYYLLCLLLQKHESDIAGIYLTDEDMSYLYDTTVTFETVRVRPWLKSHLLSVGRLRFLFKKEECLAEFREFYKLNKNQKWKKKTKT